MTDRWIILDAMGVVFFVGDDTNDLLVPFVQERVPSVSRDAINILYQSASMGELNSQQFWTEVGMSDKYPEIEKEYLDSQLIIDPQFRRTVSGLVNHYRLGMISNDLSEWSMYLRAKFALDMFEVTVISADVGIRKPNPEIYERFVNDADVIPERCVFVDDRAKNLKPASDIGMRTVRFARETDGFPFTPDREIAEFQELRAAVEEIF